MNSVSYTHLDVYKRQIHVSIDAWVGDMMHPEREIQNIQKNNPLTEERKEQILAMDGVETVSYTHLFTKFKRTNLTGMRVYIFQKNHPY